MNTSNHLSIGAHLSGPNVPQRDAESSRVPGNPPTSAAYQPSIHSFAVNIDMYLSNQPSGVSRIYTLFSVSLSYLQRVVQKLRPFSSINHKDTNTLFFVIPPNPG